jgi:hypothetical protein
MSSRLDELRRHRALLQEHLNWLDREIESSASGTQPSMPAPAIAPARPYTPPAPPSVNAAAEADRLFAQLRAEEEKQSPPPSKTGCWIIFSLILIAIIGTVGALLYFLYR